MTETNHLIRKLSLTVAGLLFAGMWLLPRVTLAQEIPKEDYLTYVPLEVPRVVGQTDASEYFRLFGDPDSPDYADASPRDGIDDNRMEVLQALGDRFAPFMVQSSEMVPLDFRAFTRDDGLPLRVDLWETAMAERILAEETVDWLNESLPACPATPNESDDCRLLELLRSYHPDEPAGSVERGRATTPQSAPFEVLWLNFPGDGPDGWKRHFADEDGRLREDLRDDVRTYLHPFLEELPAEGGERRFQLILQYWFFYPYNDGGNNHEGDWEHIHVVVSPRDRVTSEGLSEAEIRAILGGEWRGATGDDELVIKRVEFYFHSKVAFLDYSSPNVYADRATWEGESRALGAQVTGGEYWNKSLRYLAYEDDEETRVNTHPVAYIGADNKGLDQLLASPGPRNRDSHGTYPAPGLFKNIGPAGATESIHPSFDHRKFFASSPEEQRERLNMFSRGGVVFLGDPGVVEIVPDYEPVIDLVMTDVDVRRRWAWLVLPIRWGYPAHESPLAGIIAHAETGNLSIVGPSFNTGWNRSGENQQYKTYDPHVLPKLFPTSLQDAFDNNLGFLNATYPTLSFLPPFDALWRVIAAPIRAVTSPMDRVFFPTEDVPFRFVGLRGGVASHQMSDGYGDLLYNAKQGPEMIARLVDYLETNAGPETEAIGGTDLVDNQVTGVYFIDLYVGHHLVTSNGLRHGRSRIASSVEFSDIDPFRIDSELNMWEYTGSIRYSVLTDGVQPFVRGGYGLSWYRLEGYTTNDTPLSTPESEWVRKPGFIDNLLPNTWHFGVGLEVIPVRKFAALPQGIDIGLTVEWQHFTNKLGLDEVGVDVRDLILLGIPADELPHERWIGRNAFSATVAVSF